MDDLSFRLVNRAVGNAADAAGLECTARRAHAAVRRSRPSCASAAPAWTPTSTADRCRGGSRSRSAPGAGAPPRSAHRRRAAHLRRRARRHRRARSCWAAGRPSPSGGFGGHEGRTLERRRRAAGRPPGHGAGRRRRCRRRAGPRIDRRVAHRRARGPARRARRSSRRPTSTTLFAAELARCRSTAPAPACASTGPKPTLGPARRRRGRAAPVEHPRHRLRLRHHRLHRRHPGGARPRRAQPRRLHLPGHGGGGRALEARPAGAGRRGALRADRPRAGRRPRPPHRRSPSPRCGRPARRRCSPPGATPPAACSSPTPPSGDRPGAHRPPLRRRLPARRVRRR